MGLSDLMAADAEIVLDTTGFAETVSHRPQGVAASAVNVTAVFMEDLPRLERTTGELVARVAHLEVSSDLTLDVKDTWWIGGKLWHVTAIGEPLGGIVNVQIERTEREYTNKGIQVQ